MDRYFPRLVLMAVAVGAALPAAAQDWSQFRGPGGTSATATNLPTVFDESRNIAWRADLPGKGVSGPIVVGDRVFVTASGGDKQDRLYTLCFDRQTGRPLWSQELWATGRCLCHPTSANAAPTPASDGKQIYAFFSSNDLACFDLAGRLVWFRGLAIDHPKAGNDVGMASSPVVAEGVVVVQVEGPATAFVTALDTATGETIWEVERKPNASWSTPLLVAREGQPTGVVIQSQDDVSVFDLKTGEKVLEVAGRVNTVASAAVRDGRVFVPLNGTTAFDLNGDGEWVEAWKGERVQASNASAILHGDRLFTLGRGGILKSFRASDGEPLDSLRVGGNYWATPVIAGNHMYFFTQEGEARVVDLEAMKVVHEHTFEGQQFLGSPAVSGDAMYLRSNQYLYKIAGNDG